MLSFSRHSGDGILGTCSTAGKIEVFENFIGIFASQHEQNGHFLKGEVRILFDGQSPLAARSLGDLELWRALAFRGRVELNWEDLVSGEEPFDRAVTLSYEVQVSGDRTDYDGLLEEVRRDLGALDSWVDSLVKKSLRVTKTKRAPAAA